MFIIHVGKYINMPYVDPMGYHFRNKKSNISGQNTITLHPWPLLQGRWAVAFAASCRSAWNGSSYLPGASLAMGALMDRTWVQEWDTENHPPYATKTSNIHLKLHISDKKSPFPPCFQKKITLPYITSKFLGEKEREIKFFRNLKMVGWWLSLSNHLWMFVKMSAWVVRAQAQDAMKKVISLGVYLGWETNVGAHKRYSESLLGWLVRCVWLVCCVCLVG